MNLCPLALKQADTVPMIFPAFVSSTLDMFKVSVRGVAILLGHVILKECKSGKQFASIVTGYTY